MSLDIALLWTVSRPSEAVTVSGLLCCYWGVCWHDAMFYHIGSTPTKEVFPVSNHLDSLTIGLQIARWTTHSVVNGLFSKQMPASEYWCFNWVIVPGTEFSQQLNNTSHRKHNHVYVPKSESFHSLKIPIQLKTVYAPYLCIEHHPGLLASESVISLKCMRPVNIDIVASLDSQSVLDSLV